MPLKKTIQKAQKDKREGKSVFTQAGEFVKEAIDNIRKGKHGARNTKQAIAIGLSEARSAGVEIPERGSAGKKAAKKTTSRISKKKVSAKRSKAARDRLKDEPRRTVSKKALSKQTKKVAKQRGHAALSASAKKAAKTRARNKKASSTKSA